MESTPTSPNLKRRGTIAEEAAEGLIKAGENEIEEINKTKKKSFKDSLRELGREIYDSEYNEFLTRDAKAWCKLSLFYTVFYSVLAAFFIIYLFLFYHTLDLKVPKYYNRESVMDYKIVNPGLGFRPHVDPESDLVKISKTSFKSNLQSFELFLERYEKNKDKYFVGAQGADVNFNYEDIIRNTSCSKERNYGLNSQDPCVAVKLNRIFGWLPVPEANLSISVEPVEESNDRYIYVRCAGENSADRDNIQELEYFSTYPNTDVGGINFKYFPYRNQEGYLSPLVFVHFKSISYNTLINVECKAFAKNIDNIDRYNKRGMVKFQLFVEKL